MHEEYLSWRSVVYYVDGVNIKEGVSHLGFSPNQRVKRLSCECEPFDHLAPLITTTVQG